MMINAVIFVYGRIAYRDIKDYIAKKSKISARALINFMLKITPARHLTII